MNGRRFDQGHNLVPLPGPNVPEQVVAGTALRQVGALFLQYHVLGADADIHVPIEPVVAATLRESDKLLWTDLNGCQAVGHLHDLAALDGIDADDARHGEVDRRGKYLLHRAALAHLSCFEDYHMLGERERLEAIVG